MSDKVYLVYCQENYHHGDFKTNPFVLYRIFATKDKAYKFFYDCKSENKTIKNEYKIEEREIE